ncbi:type II toxin-antitoxin system RelE/ParE family toxin [Sphingomonas sp. Leaf343]|jgi:toxin ParE1/3/4|uniref:type II toxin-antitoxin system RelE/ParE family toxin n=1 Tax=Sphingomonas sp. Leaf343 TaxID=1736345 RepID=UPI000701819B|nr:type II toxin-antitoxin system RelE/ParE family toxin [Sphingomonas sp. Leaf343]KQR80467.1 hypothetical protein ASG07_15055 [Sphingomonas sp. Leaf343]
MRVNWTTPALHDLREIDTWLLREASGNVAVEVLTTIRERASALANFPQIGRPHADGHRILKVGHTPYLIRYRLVPEGVDVLRVHHERQNWSQPSR